MRRCGGRIDRQSARYPDRRAVKITLLAVGRLKDGPERALVSRYLERARDTGRAIGITGFDSIEIAESRASRPADRKMEESREIMSRLAGQSFIALDEKGRSPSSGEFSKMISDFRDGGQRALSFVIGGADGLDQSVIVASKSALAFGAMTLPHQIVRVVLSEQLYRSMTLLTGHPYHRV